MEARDRPGRSGGEIWPAKARAIGFLGGALVCGALSIGFCSGIERGTEPWVEPIIIEIAEARGFQAARSKGEKAAEKLALAISKKTRMDAEIREMESGVASLREMISSTRAKLVHYADLRYMYRSGWIHPKSRTLDAWASRSAIMQERILGTIGYDYSTLGFLFGLSSSLDPACNQATGRSVESIIKSGMASGEEKARVLASLVLAAGGEAYLVPGRTSLYALAKKGATEDDVREINRQLAALAFASGAGGRGLHGRFFGKDYYVYCEPAGQASPGLGTPPADGQEPALQLERLDY